MIKREISMEGKKKYVKPEMRVAEWDFNEAVCDSVMVMSKCINVTLPTDGSGVQAVDIRGDYTEGSDLNWSKWPSSNN